MRALNPASWPGRLSRQAPFLLIWAIVLVGLVFVATDHWRRGVIVIAAAVITAGILRVFLPVRRAGWLVVRGRWLDTMIYVLSGLALVYLALTAAG